MFQSYRQAKDCEHAASWQYYMQEYPVVLIDKSEWQIFLLFENVYILVGLIYYSVYKATIYSSYISQ